MTLQAPASRHRRNTLLVIVLGLLALWGWAAEPPAVMQAKAYRPDIDLQAYWVSEKLDGVRGRWDGRQLLTRGGHVVVAPAWFTAGWPEQPLDGELWAGRGRFETTVSTVRQQVPDDRAWQAIRFMVFDVPAHPGPFGQRTSAAAALVAQTRSPWLQWVPQERGSTHAALMAQLDKITRDGGEGLMLHRDDALYAAGRSDALLKVKTHEDAEAQVFGYEPGRGRHKGRVGALWVRHADGRRFKLGSGLSDALREQPPAIGSWVTYRFRGLHDSGLPRFATFVRVRTDAELNHAP